MKLFPHVVSFIVAFWFLLTGYSYAQDYTISGYITDTTNAETLIGAVVYDQNTSKAVASNPYGFYSLTLPSGNYTITFSFLGYESAVREIALNSNLTINMKMQPLGMLLQEVVIESEGADKEFEEMRSAQMSIIKLPVKDITSTPSIGGEVDIIKLMQLMPGVKRGDEGQTGMFVRGGDGDQNLILLDEATVYNVAHLFGFFSIFNTDALKDVTMIKGGFPASYGGRLSSVLDIRMKDGNMQNYNVEGGIGLLSSRLTLQGPVIKNKMSFIFSGRRSYVDQVFNGLHYVKESIPLLPYYFYDANLKLNYKFSDKDRVYFSVYKGDDVLKFKAGLNNSLFNFDFILGNFTSTLRWNHLYGSKLFSNVSLINSRFRYDVQGKFIDNSVFIKSSIQDLGTKIDFDYFKNPENRFQWGLSLVNHSFRPNVVSTSGEISNAYKSKLGTLISTQELSLYALHEKKINKYFGVNYGLRFSSAFSQSTFYSGLEPRAVFTFTPGEKSAVKASYSRTKQYMHLVSSSSIAFPTDLWYPVTDNVKPQSADQIALGYSRKLSKINSFINIEGYYKWMRHLIEYREGAVLILNDNYESELVSGSGKSYGIEGSINRTKGRFTGSFGYTLSWSTRQFHELNKGNAFFSKYDRRHDLSFLGKYDLTKRLSFTAAFVFATGSRLTPIVGQFIMPNSSLTNIDILPIYSDKNSIVLPPSHRLDINFVIKSKPEKKFSNEWHIGAYNFYNQSQPYRIKIVQTANGGYKYQAVGLFGFVSSVAYNFKF